MNATQTSAQVAQATTSNESINAFSSIQAFEDAQRMVKVFANSQLVPATFKGDIGSCLIALNMANRMGADPLQVMQSLYIVHGKPSFSSAFLIACFNRCGRFATIRYRMDGEKGSDDWGCTAYSSELATGEVVVGVTVTIGMAKAEGWYNKTGSKWRTMPELMLRYRAATFLIRSVAPDIALGFPTTEEAIDITDKAQVLDNDGRPTSLAEVAAQAAVTEVEVVESAYGAEPGDAEEVEPTDKGQDFTSKYFEQHHINEKQ